MTNSYPPKTPQNIPVQTETEIEWNNYCGRRFLRELDIFGCQAVDL